LCAGTAERRQITGERHEHADVQLAHGSTALAAAVVVVIVVAGGRDTGHRDRPDCQ
jgi:hypothetical protein